MGNVSVVRGSLGYQTTTLPSARACTQTVLSNVCACDHNGTVLEDVAMETSRDPPEVTQQHAWMSVEVTSHTSSCYAFVYLSNPPF